MKYFAGEYLFTTFMLFASSLCMVIGLGTKDWPLAIWCYNCWLITMICRGIIRKINKAAIENEIVVKTEDSGTDSK